MSGRDHAGAKLLLLRHQQSEDGAGARRRGGGRDKGQATHTQGVSTAQLANLRSTCGRSQEPKKCKTCTRCSEYTGATRADVWQHSSTHTHARTETVLTAAAPPRSMDCSSGSSGEPSQHK